MNSSCLASLWRRTAWFVALSPFLAAFVATSPSALGADPPMLPSAPPRLPIESYRLANGLKVVLHRDTSIPRVAVCVAYHVGSKNERAGRTGFAHFFEHMMFRGTEHVPNYDIPLQEAGSSSNAFTSEDMTVYFETVPSEFLERAIYLEAERLGFLPFALDQTKFDTEREVVKNERRQSYENVPYGLTEETLLANLYPAGHPYSWSVIGSMKDLSAATTQDLTKFFAEFYHPGNAVLCLSGHFEVAQARQWIERYFGPLRPGPEVKSVTRTEVRPVAKRVTIADQVALPRLSLAWPSVATDHPDSPALDVLADVLAGGNASRLHESLVLGPRLASEVSASNNSREISGQFEITATANPGKTLAEIEKAIDAQLARLRDQPPSASELERARAKYETGTLNRLTSLLSRAITLSMGFSMYGNPEFYREEYARTIAVTPEDVQRVARKYFAPERIALTVRPLKPGEAKTAAVQVGPNADATSERALTPKPPEGGPDWAVMPKSSGSVAWKPPSPTRGQLGNGVALWSVRWSSLPLVSCQIVLDAGSSYDPEGKLGLAELTARLLDQGTAKLTATELAKAFETLGASVSVNTSLDHTSISLSVIARNFAPALDLVGQMLVSPRFSDEDFDREKELMLTELLQGPDDPNWIASRVFPMVLQGENHPYGRPADGTTDSVKSLSIADVKAFHQARYITSNANIVVVGDVVEPTLPSTVSSLLKGWARSETPPTLAFPARKAPEPGILYLVDKPGAVQSVIRVGRIWVDRKDPSYFACQLGNYTVGGDFLSRLNQNLRERNGYTYGAGSAFVYRRSGSAWGVRTSVRADVTGAALKEVLGELDGLGTNRPLTENEIATARRSEILSFPEGFESPASIAGRVAEIALFDLPHDYLETVLDQLRRPEPEVIRAVMKRVAEPGDRVILVVGDRKSIEPQLKAAGVKTVKVLNTEGKPQ